MPKEIDFDELSIHDTPKQSPGFLLWHVSTTWRKSIEEVLKPIGLTHPRFVVLATLGWLTKEGDRATQAEIGKMAGLDPNTISQILKGLEKIGLIKRVQSNDARVKNPLLTLLGNKSLKKALPAVEEADQQFFSALSKNDMGHLLKLFQKLTPQ